MTRAGPVRTAGAWARIVAEAYAAETRPPLTPHVLDRVERDLAETLGAAGTPDAIDQVWIDRVNAVLDAFENALDAVAGPRLVAADEAAGTVRMEHRSEAGQPLRAFGGQ